MFFLNLWYLWFLPLAAIPVLLNLWKRKRVKEVAFPYFNLLMEANVTNLSPLKIMNFLLLLLRILFIVFLILFMARPYLFSTDSIASLSLKDVPVVFVLDNSLSMTYTYDRTSLFRRSVNLIEDSLKTLDADIPCALMYINKKGDIETERSFDNPERLLLRLRSLKPVYYRFNMKDVFANAETFFLSLGQSAKRNPKKIIIFSDNQRVNWADLHNVNLPDCVKINFVIPLSMDYNGVGWIGFRFPDRLVKTGENSFVAAIMENFGKDKIDGLIVRFFIDGALLDESMISLEAGERKEKKFYYSLQDTKTVHKAVLSIESPDFQIDNELKLVLPLYPYPKVVVINNSDKDIYLDSVFKPYFKDNDNSYVELAADSVNMSDLRKKDIIIFVENENDTQVADTLKNIVAKGVNAVVFKAPNTSKQDSSSNVISYAEFSHPVLLPYKIMGVKAMGALWFYSANNKRFLPELPYRDILLSSSGGKIFMEEITFGKGRIIVFYTDPYGVTSNFVNTSLFLPLLHRVMDYFVKNKYSITGEVNKVFPEKISLSDEYDFSVQWITPEGEKHTYNSIFINGLYTAGSFITTSDGYYTLKTKDDKEYVISYITPFYEGDLTQVSKDEFLSKFNGRKIFFSDMLRTTAGKAVTDKFKTSKILLILCLIIFLLELAAANLCS
ncbi:BatA domain-containing protein [bacterium]|nr:BatA domain-containing protein [bacterium]